MNRMICTVLWNMFFVFIIMGSLFFICRSMYVEEVDIEEDFTEIKNYDRDFWDMDNIDNFTAFMKSHDDDYRQLDDIYDAIEAYNKSYRRYENRAEMPNITRAELVDLMDRADDLNDTFNLIEEDIHGLDDSKGLVIALGAILGASGLSLCLLIQISLFRGKYQDIRREKKEKETKKQNVKIAKEKAEKVKKLEGENDTTSIAIRNLNASLERLEQEKRDMEHEKKVVLARMEKVVGEIRREIPYISQAIGYYISGRKNNGDVFQMWFHRESRGDEKT